MEKRSKSISLVCFGFGLAAKYFVKELLKNKHIARAAHAYADAFERWGKTLKDLGWRLRHTPREPVGAAWRILGTGKPHRIWIPYLKPFGVEAMGAASA